MSRVLCDHAASVPRMCTRTHVLQHVLPKDGEVPFVQVEPPGSESLLVGEALSPCASAMPVRRVRLFSSRLGGAFGRTREDVPADVDAMPFQPLRLLHVVRQ